MRRLKYINGIGWILWQRQATARYWLSSLRKAVS